MSKRRKRSRQRKGQCPEPINTMIDLAGATAMGLYVNHKIKKDFRNGCGEESAKAATAVYGIGAMREGSKGMISLGGLVGLNAALNSVQNQKTQQTGSGHSTPYISPIEPPSPAIKHPAKAGIWREHCEDGTEYGLDPLDFEAADDYEAALQEAKDKIANDFTPQNELNDVTKTAKANTVEKGGKYKWRKYCEDGTKYGIRPEDYETADDYVDALKDAKKHNTGGI